MSWLDDLLGCCVKTIQTNGVPAPQRETLDFKDMRVTAESDKLVLSVSGLAGKQLSQTAPLVGQTLVYDGMQWAPSDMVGGSVTAAKPLIKQASQISIEPGPAVRPQLMRWTGTDWTVNAVKPIISREHLGGVGGGLALIAEALEQIGAIDLTGQYAGWSPSDLGGEYILLDSARAVRMRDPVISESDWTPENAKLSEEQYDGKKWLVVEGLGGSGPIASQSVLLVGCRYLCVDGFARDINGAKPCVGDRATLSAWRGSNSTSPQSIAGSLEYNCRHGSLTVCHTVATAGIKTACTGLALENLSVSNVKCAGSLGTFLQSDSDNALKPWVTHPKSLLTPKFGNSKQGLVFDGQKTFLRHSVPADDSKFHHSAGFTLLCCFTPKGTETGTLLSNCTAGAGLVVRVVQNGSAVAASVTVRNAAQEIVCHLDSNCAVDTAQQIAYFVVTFSETGGITMYNGGPAVNSPAQKACHDGPSEDTLRLGSDFSGIVGMLYMREGSITAQQADKLLTWAKERYNIA